MRELIEALHKRCDACGSIFPGHRCSMSPDWQHHGLSKLERQITLIGHGHGASDVRERRP